MAIQVKRGTAAQWTSQNITLEAGQPGLEIDTMRLKVGDGETTWNSLKYTDDDTRARIFSGSITFQNIATFNSTINIGDWAINHDSNGLTIRKG